MIVRGSTRQMCRSALPPIVDEIVRRRNLARTALRAASSTRLRVFVPFKPDAYDAMTAFNASTGPSPVATDCRVRRLARVARCVRV